jgi:hypothetical protein
MSLYTEKSTLILGLQCNYIVLCVYSPTVLSYQVLQIFFLSWFLFFSLQMRVKHLTAPFILVPFLWFSARSRYFAGIYYCGCI